MFGYVKKEKVLQIISDEARGYLKEMHMNEEMEKNSKAIELKWKYRDRASSARTRFAACDALLNKIKFM